MVERYLLRFVLFGQSVCTLFPAESILVPESFVLVPGELLLFSKQKPRGKETGLFAEFKEFTLKSFCFLFLARPGAGLPCKGDTHKREAVALKNGFVLVWR